MTNRAYRSAKAERGKMDWLTDRIIEIIEDAVGGKVYSLYYNTEKRTYDVGFEKDYRLQQQEVSRDLIEERLRKEEH